MVLYQIQENVWGVGVLSMIDHTNITTFITANHDMKLAYPHYI